METTPSFYATKTEIIAEAGCNHFGDTDKMVQLIRSAKECGADTIKFQSFVADYLVNPDEAVKAFCQQCELTYDDHCTIVDECETVGIKPLFSAFDMTSLSMVQSLGLDEVKIPSGQAFNHLLLHRAAGCGMRTYVSTGMCSMRAVQDAFFVLTAGGLSPENIVLMQCTTSYPAPLEDANLRVIPRYRNVFKTPVGYSDHTPGWVAAVAAVAMGANVIEKHFILDTTEDSPDACVSLNPVGFKGFVEAVRVAEAVLGTDVKRPRKCEEKMFKRRDYGGKK